MHCYAGKFAHGMVKVSRYELTYEFQFIDYIYGGCDISTMVAMDCSLRNGHPSQKGSLHYLPPNQPREDDAASIGGVTSRSLASKKSRFTDNLGTLNRMIK